MNNPFDQTIENPRERPLSSDVNQGLSQMAIAIRMWAMSLFAKRTSSSDRTAIPVTGFLGGSLLVRASAAPDMSINIMPGVGFQDLAAGSVANGDPAIMAAVGGISGVDDLFRYKPLPVLLAQNLAVPAAPGVGNSRIDIVEVLADRRVQDSSNRDILNPMTGIFAPGLVNKILAYLLDGRTGSVNSPSNSTTGIGYKVGASYVGTTYVGGNVPATSPGYIKIAEIFVGPTVASITNAVINDCRPLIFAGDVDCVEGIVDVTTFDPGMGDISLINSHTFTAPPGVDILASPSLVLGEDLFGVILSITAGGGNTRPGSITATARMITGAATYVALPIVITDPAFLISSATGQQVLQAKIGAIISTKANGTNPQAITAGVDDRIAIHYRMSIPRV